MGSALSKPAKRREIINAFIAYRDPAIASHP
jgi:hypothetical protein